MIKAFEHLGVSIDERRRDRLKEDLYRAMLDAEGASIGQYSFEQMTQGLTDIRETPHHDAPEFDAHAQGDHHGA